MNTALERYLSSVSPWLILRHAVFGIRGDFNEASRPVERVSCGQEFQTLQPHDFVADLPRI